MSLEKKINLDEFFSKNKYFSIKPSNYDGLILEGDYYLTAHCDGYKEVTNEKYKLRICISNKFPSIVPSVKELEGKIPDNINAGFHINGTKEKTFCMGSPIRLLELIHKNPTLQGFIEKCLVPYLYAVTLKLKYNIDFIFGELAHGDEGLIYEYKNIFNVSSEDEVLNILKCFTVRKRISNKWICPCNCGNRLGKCKKKLNIKINSYRKYIKKASIDDILTSKQK